MKPEFKRCGEGENTCNCKTQAECGYLIDKKDLLCKKCGEEMEWQECWSCGGEGGRGWDDLQFEDPLWYSPDDFIDCDECEGRGGVWICPNKH